MLTHEQRRALPKKRSNRQEIDAFYLMAATLSAMLTCEKDLEARAKMVPGGWRDLRLIRTKTENLLRCILHTFEPVKQYSIDKQMQHLRLKTVFGPEAAKEPEMFMLPTEDLALLIHAATQECKLLMCPSGDCARCRLGKVLDSASFVSRGDRAWWEVFEQARKRDVGMED